jgi:diadenosine tetraphosphatase ApaH/serine/threonine PP2A family protein phosphatase
MAVRSEAEVLLHNDAYYLVNPGTVGAPRTSDRRASYMIVDLATRRLTLHRVDYDASAAFAATRKAGLAPRLAFVPAPVRRALGKGLRSLRIYDLVRQLAALIFGSPQRRKSAIRQPASSDRYNRDSRSFAR